MCHCSKNTRYCSDILFLSEECVLLKRHLPMVIQRVGNAIDQINQCTVDSIFEFVDLSIHCEVIFIQFRHYLPFEQLGSGVS